MIDYSTDGRIHPEERACDRLLVDAGVSVVRVHRSWLETDAPRVIVEFLRTSGPIPHGDLLVGEEILVNQDHYLCDACDGPMPRRDAHDIALVRARGEEFVVHEHCQDDVAPPCRPLPRRHLNGDRLPEPQPQPHDVVRSR